MRNLVSVAFFLSLLAQLFQPVFASDISAFPDTSLFIVSGEIQKGDAEKLIRAILRSRYPISPKLVLDSPGGDVEEALRMASLAKALYSSTEVADGGTCASACFFIFLAGEDRLAAGTIDGERYSGRSLGYIGLHHPYSKLDPSKRDGSLDAEILQHEVMQKVSAYLRNQDVPQRLIDLMMSRPSNDIYWMTQDDIDQLGEYSPGREELMISRCGYSRNLIEDIWTERDSNDIAIAARGEARYKAFVKCAATAFPDLDDEVIMKMNRLRKGWRPWSTSKVAGKKQ